MWFSSTFMHTYTQIIVILFSYKIKRLKYCMPRGKGKKWNKATGKNIVVTHMYNARTPA